MRVAAVVFATVLSGIPVLGACQAIERDPESVPVPATPAAINRVLVTQPFTLSTPFRFTWSKEQPMVSSGTLVVLDVDKALVAPRNALEPVLYAGNTPVMRLNYGHRSGRVIGIVPGPVDLASVPIWFGTPELPERVTAEMAGAERARAERAAIAPPPGAQLRAVRRAPAASADLATLLRTVGANLVIEFSPQEKDLADTWRLPVAKPPPVKRPN